MDCLKCGFSNPDDACFCAGCGTSLTSLKCPHCETENAPGSRFCNRCGKSLTLPGQQQRAPATQTTRSKAERRLLTVMFCDLVDSTSIVADLDPEETRSIIRKFQSHCRSVIEQFGGRITEYLGDGIVAQFTGHETNAERAVYSALELIRELRDAQIKFGEQAKSVQVRCSIATGLAVVGDMLGDSRIRSESAIGLPLNLAARIQSLANPDEIIIAGETHRLTHGLFEFEDLGLHSLKGIKNPQHVWRVLKEKHVSSRFAAHTVEITPMVDRQEVLDVLLAAWKDSKRGQAAAVVFSGEAGIGKSRILQELCKTIEKDLFYFFNYQCAPYHVNTSLYPVINRLEDAAGFEYGDSHERRLDKLESLIRRSNSDYKSVMPAFASLLGIYAGDQWPAPELDPEEKKKWMFNALLSNMFSLAISRPLLIIVEDVHWIDPTTLELMSRMVLELPGHPILLLITTRPGFSPDFLDESHVSLLEIDRLPEEYTAKLLRGVKGAESLPREVLDEVIRRTEGIPLFIEELSKSLLEGMTSTDSPENSSQLAKNKIPTTLHDSLLSRLDRLPNESRFIAQLAAVIGREFSFDLLERVADYRDKNLYQVLTPLLESQLVFQDKPPPAAEFRFKHALVRDVAYENLLQSERVDIHKRIARAIEDNYPEVIKRTPELVARHFSEGKVYEKAVHYWLDAGKKASQSSANVEARNHLQSGLSIIDKLDKNDTVLKYELKLLLALGPIIMSSYGTGAEETHKIYQRAVDISTDDSDSELRFAALWNRWRMSVDEGFLSVVNWADELLKFAEKTNNVEQLLQAHHCQWGTLYNLGKHSACCKHIEAGIGYYNEDEHGHHALTYGGHDPKVCGFSQSALSFWLMGRYRDASSGIQKGQQWADHLNHLGTHLHQIDISLMYYRFCNDPEKVLQQINKLKQLIDLLDYPDYCSKANIYSGWARGMIDGESTALQLLEEGVKRHTMTGTWEDKPVFLEMSAQIKFKFEDYKGAMIDIENAIESAKLSGVAYWNAELYRRKAGLLYAINDSYLSKEIIDHYIKAIDIASEQFAKTLELRARISLARIYFLSGDNERSLSIINPIVDYFPDPEVTEDVRRAYSLINDIQSD